MNTYCTRSCETDLSYLFMYKFYFNKKYVIGRSQMFARILNSDSVRPVFIHQQSNQDSSSQGPTESNT